MNSNRKSLGIVAGGVVCTLLCFSSGAAQDNNAASAGGRPPVTVFDTISTTINNHRGVKIMQENREAIEHELDRARAGWGPRVDINAGFGVGVLSNSTTRAINADKGMYQASNVGVTLTQPLWDGFATRSRVRATEATLNSMIHRVFDNATTLGLDGLIAHVDVLRRREVYRLSLDNVANHEAILAQTRDREMLGADTMADVTQAESRLARARSTLVEARTALRDAEDVYYRLTSVRPPANLAPVEMSPILYGNPTEVFDETMIHNPKLLAYIEDVNVTKGDEQLARSAFHPTINLEAGPHYSDREGKGSNWVYSFDVMGVVRWNVFNSGADMAGLRAAQARVRESRQYARNFLDDVTQEIETTWTAWESAKEQLQHYTDAVGYNRVTLEAYKDQFILGMRSLLDVLDAENELYNSATQVITSESNVIVGSYKLLALTGTFLPALNVSTEGVEGLPEALPPEPREKY